MCNGIYNGIMDSRCFGDHSRNRVHIGSQHVSIPEREREEQGHMLMRERKIYEGNETHSCDKRKGQDKSK